MPRVAGSQPRWSFAELRAPLACALLVLAVVPFADVRVGFHPALLPAYFAVLAACKLTTVAVLVAQHRAEPRLGILGLALTYASGVLLAVGHGLTMPGVVAPGGIAPELPALTLWLWVAWHVAFPLGLLVTALLPATAGPRGRSAAWAALLVIAPVGGLVAGLVVAQPVLPPMVTGDDYGSLATSPVGVGTLLVGSAAVVVAVRQRARLGQFGQWILLATLFTIADSLLTLVAGERLTVGWYAGRVCELVASAAVLIAILRQAVRLAGALARSNESLHAAREDAERQAEEHAAAARRFSMLLEGMGDAFAALDRDGTIAFVNSYGAALLGDSAGALVGRRLSDVLPEGTGAEFASQLEPLRHGARAVAFELRHPRIARWLSVRAWAAGDLVSMSVRDVSERREAEERLAYRALHDPLTGLANRTLLLDRLEQLTSRRPEDPARVAAILFIDLDRFKPVNDSFGHPAGDAVLKQVAARLSALVRPADTVARLGGDEFVLLCEEVADRDAATRVADRVRVAIEEPIVVGGHEVTVSASVGIALVRPDDRDPAALLADADAAMYAAKARRGDRAARFGTLAGHLLHR